MDCRDLRLDKCLLSRIGLASTHNTQMARGRSGARAITPRSRRGTARKWLLETPRWEMKYWRMSGGREAALIDVGTGGAPSAE